MSKKLKAKVALLVCAVIASMAVMGITLSQMQANLSLADYRAEMQEEAAQLPELLQEASDESAENTKTYDAIYQSKAASVAFLAQNNTGYEATHAKMVEYQDLLGVTNVMVVKKDGTIVAQAADTKADFSAARFNQLRTCLSSGDPSEAVEVNLADEDWTMRYYAAKLDDDTMVVVEQDPSELTELVASTGSVASVLKDISVGQNGYVFAVSSKDYSITYHPDESLIGTDALGQGIDVTELEDGDYGWLELAGNRLYCGVSVVDDTYYVFAVPENDMTASRNLTVGVILFAFFVVIAAVVLYGVFVMADDEKNGHTADEFAHVGGLVVNRTIRKRAAVLAVVGLIGVLVVSFYMQTLFALSSQSITNAARAEQVAESMQQASDQTDELKEQYSERYLSKAKVAAYAIQNNPELASRAKLQELADVLDVQYLYTFDGTGTMTATNSSYSHYSLSDDPDDSSYEFRKLLQGVDSVVQNAGTDEISGELRQYIGVALYKEDGEANGFVQLGIRPTRLENQLKSVQIDHVLDGIKAGTSGFAFAVNASDGTIAYFPDSKLIGKQATEVGMTEAQLKGGYSDYLTIDGTTYYAASVEQGDYYLYVAGPEGELMSERLPLTLTTGGIAAVCLAIVFALVTLEPKDIEQTERLRATSDDDQTAGSAGDDSAKLIDVQMPGGRTAKTQSAASRWLNKSLKWDDRTPEQRLALVMRVFAGVAVLCVFAAVLFKDTLLPKGSVFSYILGGGWEKGLNVFAVTASIMAACVAITLVSIACELLRVLSGALSARGETVCRLLASCVKYVTVIGMVYYCLMLIGIDTGTLLASAGLLTLAVSLGAKDLVADILSGLFIICEGEFRVGDIIQVGSSKGTVMDIGVRTTKINDGSGNILVMRNSNISNVVNMTKELSVASIEVGIEYGESLERVESVLSRELPKLAERIPAIVDGPFYKGVCALGDNSVNIKITAKCKEKDRGGVTNDLNRAMKLLFDQYDISMPYPQIVVNEPFVYQEATTAEKSAADKFNAEQKVASEGAEEEQGFDAPAAPPAQ
jgi:moderate conductance mechanosensitive channel